MSFHLVDAHGTTLADFPPGGGSLVVGRSAECSLILSDPTVSRRHAEVHIVDDHLVVMDLGSRNGTFRNGVRVERARLRAGDVVAFGVVPLRVEGEGENGEVQQLVVVDNGVPAPIAEPELLPAEATSGARPASELEEGTGRPTPSADAPAIAAEADVAPRRAPRS